MNPVGLSLRTRWLVATGFGTGLVPVAPGTAGSLLAVALGWLLHGVGGAPAIVVGCASAILAGLWSSGAVARHLRLHDPGSVVIDEIAGQLLTLAFLPAGVVPYCIGFLSFRLFDIVKPFPARRLESLPGASGIMADDLVAGVYAGFAAWLLLRLIPVALGWG